MTEEQTLNVLRRKLEDYRQRRCAAVTKQPVPIGDVLREMFDKLGIDPDQHSDEE